MNNFYNNDGSFNPLTSSHGNISKNIADLRNTYLEAEKEYFEALLQDKEIFNWFNEMLQYDSETLANFAINEIKKIECGELLTQEEIREQENMTFEEKDNIYINKLSTSEAKIALALAAIKDKVLVKELVLTLSHSRR